MAPKEIPLKRNDKNNPQIKSYTDAIKRGQKSIHIFPKDGKWEVKRIGNSDIGSFNSQREAIDYAKKIAENNQSELITHGSDGLIQERRSFAPDPYPPQN